MCEWFWKKCFEENITDKKVVTDKKETFQERYEKIL